MTAPDFMNYVPTPEEKYMGVATTRHTLDNGNKLILRWKCVPNKEGEGYFIVPASMKMADTSGQGQNVFAESHMLDSRSDHEDLMKFIRTHVNSSMNQATSVHQSRPSTQVFQPKEEDLPF